MKKILLFFAIAMMAITASAKVYEVSFLLSDNFILLNGLVKYGDDPQSTVVNGVKITAVNGSIEPESGGHGWFGTDGGNSFQISTENGETITRIEITAGSVTLQGTGWTKTAPGAVWTGSATSVNVGESFSNVTKLTVTVDETTAIKNVETTSSQKAGKFINDGKLVIVKDGKLYNANGCIVK